MSRIPDHEYQILLSKTKDSIGKVNEYQSFKASLKIPNRQDNSYDALISASKVLHKIFFERKFNILDAVVAERGYGPRTPDDTHYRGRVLESVLNGSFSGESAPDFAYGDLKLIETKDMHKIAQVMTVGSIFTAVNKDSGDYSVVDNYAQSNFYKKVKQCLIMSYLKEGKQLGMTPNNIMPFTADNPLWAKELKEDWESIRDEMKQTIIEYKSGKRKRKPSGICKSDTSGKRRPNGYLGIRSDCVIFTAKFFELVSNYYYNKKD